MEKIGSFKKNHNTMQPGFYYTAIMDDLHEYDLRFKTPNNGDYLSVSAMHTIEHLFATAIRDNALKDKVIYFGPYGCRTGFALIMRNIPMEQALPMTIEAFEKCLLADTVPGNKKIECGNYRSHNLSLAQQEIRSYLEIIKKP
ncbi:MAG: S-ribosylhomocysteine lyase [Clostridiaceae bacterium]|jgi:S-ribosylhomocysteine lyase|nr:S-ribosylhomocysteine lyase [Clostridiaceae bacterium]